MQRNAPIRRFSKLILGAMSTSAVLAAAMSAVAAEPPAGTATSTPASTLPEQTQQPAAGPEAAPADNVLAGGAEEGWDLGQTGSFGSRLEALAAELDLFVHAYATIELAGQPKLANGDRNPNAWTFDPRYFNLFVGGRFGPIQPELQLELEHATEVGARIAQVDFIVADALVFRAGVFLVPFGVYNEYYYPEYTRPLPRRPQTLVLDRVVPVVWNDVGVQIRGRGEFGDTGLGWNYALYVGNGLQRKAGRGATAIRDMRGNYLETLGDDKATGGRVGLSLMGVDAGFSAYRGAYDDGPKDLVMFGADIHHETDDYGFLAEWAWSRFELDTTGDRYFFRYGATVQGHYAITPWLRPAAMVDIFHEAGSNRLRLVPIIAFYPAPVDAPKTSVRIAYGRSFKLNRDLLSNEETYLLQVATGF